MTENTKKGKNTEGYSQLDSQIKSVKKKEKKDSIEQIRL